MSRDQQQYLKEELEWLQKYNDAYREGLQNLSNSDYVRGLLRAIADKLANVFAYNPNENPAHTAVFIIGEVQAKMEKTLTQLDFMDQYEDRRRDYDETIANIDSQDDGSHGGPPEVLDEL